MKKIALSALVLGFGTVAVQAQVKIGDNPTTINPASLFEMESSNKGMLVPRVTLTDRLVWGLNGIQPEKGMIVYSKAVGANGLDSGLVIWEGAWNKFASKELVDNSNDEWVNDNSNAKIHIGKLSDGTSLRPSGTEFVVTDQGKVGIGTNTPSVNFQVVHPTESVRGEFGSQTDFKSGSAMLNHHGANNLSVHLGFYKSLAGATINPGSTLGSIVSYGYVDGVYKSSGTIAMKHDVNKPLTTSGTYFPGRLSFNLGDENGVNVERAVINSDGSVGIGTNNPAVKLDVNQGSIIQRPVKSNLFNSFLRTNGNNLYSSDSLTPGVLFYGNNSVSTAYGAHLGNLDGSSTGYTTELFTSNVGSISFSKLNKNASGVALQSDFDRLMVIRNDGKVGIGTSAPSENLQVVAPVATDAAIGEFGSRTNFRSGRVILNHHGNNALSSNLSFYKSTGGGNITPGSTLGSIVSYGYVDGVFKSAGTIALVHDETKSLTSAGTYMPGKITFSVGNEAGSNPRRAVINSDGNFGVNVADPLAKLHIIKAAADLTPAIIVGCPVHVDNTAAVAAGLPVGALYRTADGTVKVVF